MTEDCAGIARFAKKTLKYAGFLKVYASTIKKVLFSFLKRK